MHKVIQIVDREGNIRYEGIIYRIPLRPDVIAENGRKIYGDVPLCVLRWEVVKKRMYFEIEEQIMPLSDRILLEDLPGEIMRMFDLV